MDYLTRIVVLFICCISAGSVANGNFLDTVKNVVWKLTGNSIISYDQKHESRRFLNDATNVAWTAWHAASKCTTSCGPGFTEEQRSCSTGNNQDCQKQGGTYWRLGQCNTPCGAHWMEWSVLKACSVTCGVGVVVRKRACNTGSAGDCTEGKAIEFSTCSPGDCITTTQTVFTTGPPVWSTWSAAKACTKTCGHGFSERTRTCSTGHNSDCKGLPWEVLGCNEGPCVVDGSWGDWSVWSDCSASCGQSQRSRNRTCIYGNPAQPGQPCSGVSIDQEDCNKPSCAVDGQWSEWTKYSACTVSCGQGFKVRDRDCTYSANAPHGKSCTGRNNDLTICTDAQCAVDGTWVEWTNWTPCSKTCGGGYEFRNRFCKYENGKPRGKACEGNVVDGKPCEITKCSVDGSLSQWSSWTECSHTCNGGLQSRNRACLFDSTAPHGADCNGTLKENRNCGTLECPVDGTWGSWGSWAQCSQTCGSSSSIRNRNCEYKTLTAPHGKVCVGESFEKKNCSDTPCQVDGTWSTWTAFSKCTVTCGDGDEYRTRTCKFTDTQPRGNQCQGRSVDARTCHKTGCAVDGTFTNWGSWSICLKSCGNGTQVRSRDCYFPQNVRHGKDCVGSLTEVTTCNESPCAETTTMMTTTTEASANGSWSTWGNWSSCSLSCGTGSQSRSRVCTYPDHTLHAQVCPGSNITTRDCNTDFCAVDGAWSSWSLFGRCSASCGNGTRTRTRTCAFNILYPKGADCVGNNTDTGSCSAGLCPVDGSWGAWGVWSSCPVSCGGSVIERTRVCEYQAGIPHGQDCVGQTHENKTCNTDLCPVDGSLSQWTTWTDCPVTCGNGTHTRSRSCDFPVGVPHGKDCVGDLSQLQLCSFSLCPVDGVFTDWSDWKRCSKSCGGGLQQRNRYCHYDQHAPHGKSCSGATTETKDCNKGLCPVDGIWAGWGPWSVCSKTCEEGVHSRSRKCSFLHGYPHGKDCVGTNNQTEACNNGPCPVNGTWSTWSVWSQCSASCDNGTSSRDRSCDFPPGSVHGANCTGNAREEKVCLIKLCPVDGLFSVWSQWANCPVTCGGGVSSRQRQCQFDSQAPHGQDCVGVASQSQNCSTDLCAVDGTWGTWSPFTNCSHTCGNGTMFRKRKCEFTAGHPHGANCSGHETESASCNPNPCPVDGHFTDWSVWSDCSKSCNNGTQSRARRCDFDNNAPHGKTCVGDYKENIPCNEEICPINGHWSNWTNYSTCSSSCGNGTHARSRSCIFHDPAPHGSQCFGNTNETTDCNITPCAVDGVWNDWTTWSVCSKTCGTGKRTRGRVCYFPPGVPQGDYCTGKHTQIEDCNLTQCAVDGTLSSWSPWSNCSVTCGDGAQFRTRKCTYPTGAPHGKDCGNVTLNEANSCQEALCTADGQWSSWKSWGGCDVTCGNGTRSRSRDCEFTKGMLHGDNCTGVASETGSCSKATCPVNGSWGTWSDFSSCTKSCGNGTATRTRTCDFPAGATHGLDCAGNTQEILPCNVTDCREDGVWGDWTAWSACSATCGASNKTHTRTCNWPTSVHGNTCQGDSTETAPCNATLCPVNGTWSNWENWSTCSASCDAGMRSRTRQCNFDAHAPHGADCEGSKKQDDSCKITDCTVDGIWSSWTKWGVCSQTCENGTESRSRNCVFSPPTAPKGKNCSGDVAETRTCTNPQDCAVNGNWTVWSSWSACSATCGNVEKHRTRTCEFDPNKPRGHDCFGQANQTVSCGLPTCPVDGQWGSWLSWQACSVTCGSTPGTKQRSRTCTFAAGLPHGKNCSGNAVESSSCGTSFECPVSGFWDTWQRWHHCSATCGGGTRIRARDCVFPPHVQQGSYCTGSGRDQESCNTQACP